MRLTEKKCRNAEWSGKDYLISDGHGLNLRIRETSKTWILRKTYGGKATVKTIGKYPKLTLKEARKLCLYTKYQDGLFNKDDYKAPSWITEPGERPGYIYFLYKSGKCIYIGQTKNQPHKRLNEHARSKDYDGYSFFPVPAQDMDEIESLYIRANRPPQNKILKLF